MIRVSSFNYFGLVGKKEIVWIDIDDGVECGGCTGCTGSGGDNINEGEGIQDKKSPLSVNGDNGVKTVCKQDIINGRITYAMFAHRQLTVLPQFITNLYNHYVKGSGDHSASHAFVILSIAMDNVKTDNVNMVNQEQEQTVVKTCQLCIDFDGSLNVRLIDDIPSDWKPTVRGHVDNLNFGDFLNKVNEVGLPDYDHSTSNCKHFMELLSKILFGEDIDRQKYLSLIHRKRIL